MRAPAAEGKRWHDRTFRPCVTLREPSWWSGVVDMGLELLLEQEMPRHGMVAEHLYPYSW